ncbi:MAG: DUF4102 domain-containing protein, partial [Chloroflexi bacterium]|nr:DUF4102 domain-containing protein [Chloroflexota bacterium]
MSVTSTQFVDGGGGQSTATYEIEPGYVRQAEVHIQPNEAGRFNIVGYVAYYLKGDESSTEYRTVSLPVTVSSDEQKTNETSGTGSGRNGGLNGIKLTLIAIGAGLGGALLVSLSEAREKALENRKLARAGGDPLAEKRNAKAGLTFEETARKAHE